MIEEYLDEKLITFLDVDDQERALDRLIDLSDGEGKLLDREAFRQAIFKREKIVSTGIGMSVAIPHAKLPGYKSFFITNGIHPRGIEWEALDGVPVRLIFMIGGPDDHKTEYLQLLSNLTNVIKDEERRKKMLQLKNAHEMMALFEGI